MIFFMIFTFWIVFNMTEEKKMNRCKTKPLTWPTWLTLREEDEEKLKSLRKGEERENTHRSVKVVERRASLSLALFIFLSLYFSCYLAWFSVFFLCFSPIFLPHIVFFITFASVYFFIPFVLCLSIYLSLFPL